MNALHAKLAKRWPKEIKTQYHAFVQGYDCGRAESQERIRVLETGLREAIKIIRAWENTGVTSLREAGGWIHSKRLPELERIFSIEANKMNTTIGGKQS